MQKCPRNTRKKAVTTTLHAISRLLLPLLIVAAWTACSDSAPLPDGPTAEVKIATRAGTDIPYPILFYAFHSETGEMAASTQASSADDAISLSLPAGNYRLVAVSGVEECSYPQSPTLDDLIRMPETACTTRPVMMGSADVSVSQNTTTDITMYYSVAAMTLTLQGVPQEVEAVKVTLADLYNAMDYRGDYSGCATATLPCTRQAEGEWTTPATYLYPGCSQKLHLSVTLTRPDGSQTYGYTHASNLKAATPYRLTGSFQEGFTVNGSLSAAGWEAIQEASFVFGLEENGTPDSPDDSEGEETEYHETEILPTPGSIWQGHFVADTLLIAPNEAILTLLSLKEWRGVKGSDEASNEAQALVDSYTEGEWSKWSIPTAEEARRMTQELAGNSKLSTSNTLLAQAGGAPLADISEHDDEGNSVRYLCEGGSKTFYWYASPSITATYTNRTYYLRAVKHIRVKQSDNNP
ncbi:MAG: FimB/Mfa2 family fimbrial subunit [Bacteroides sp.]|nr:FimB/Mfa2 family fimbrial subunit [Bacteroides sp.]